MNLRIAKLLLLLSVMGNLAPVALAIAAPAPHACCLRKSVHPCHESVSADQAVLRSANCCNHDCCRAVTIARSAYAQSAVKTDLIQIVGNLLVDNGLVALKITALGSQLTRGPPHSLLAS